MPGMDGFSTARQTRKLSVLGADSLPIVVLFAHVFAESRTQAAAAGMNAYLTKPLDIKLLKKELLSHLAPKLNFTETSPSLTTATPTASIPKSEPIVLSAAPTPSLSQAADASFLKVRRAIALLGGNRAL
jgi:CheY-like chemotaxis protein